MELEFLRTEVRTEWNESRDFVELTVVKRCLELIRSIDASLMSLETPNLRWWSRSKGKILYGERS